jgi:hypothetical protein
VDKQVQRINDKHWYSDAADTWAAPPLEFGFIVIWRFLLLVYLKLSLYVDLEHQKCVSQPVAEFPNI